MQTNQRSLPKSLPKELLKLSKIKASHIRRETDLQNAVASLLPGVKADAEPTGRQMARLNMGGEIWQWNAEHSFNAKDRIDFVAWSITREGMLTYGIECKKESGGMATMRQLERYAKHVDVLILVTCAPATMQVTNLLAAGKRPVPVIIFELWKNL